MGRRRAIALHKCPGPGCDEQCPGDMLMCRVHWFQVPKHIRDEVWAAWDHRRGEGTARHARAIAAAIESITP